MRLLRKSGDVPKRSLWQRIKDVALLDVAVLAKGGVSAGSLEQLEQLLLEADFGVPVTLRLVADVERRAKRGLVKTQDEFQAALAEGIDAALARRHERSAAATWRRPRPTVILVVGVNGAGKTTFIGKLSAQFRVAGQTRHGRGWRHISRRRDRPTSRVVRADRRRVRRRRGRAPIRPPWRSTRSIRRVARGVDVLIIDTAGRLHTSDGLMDELRKVARVIAKRLPGAPHETLLVLDGTIGQNAVQQAKIFAAAVPVTGLVVTKLDGTARGGVVVAVHEAIDAPVKFLGVGESASDLVPFDATAFAQELLSDE